MSRTIISDYVGAHKAVREETQQKRLRALVHKLNKARKKQARKIDILCGDLISAQRTFIKKLDAIGFAANFYEAIVGVTDLSALFYTAGRLFKDEIPDANFAFFTRREENFELHMLEDDKPITLDRQGLENCFTAELVRNICRCNRICTLQDMFAMGLQGNLVALNKVSAAAIPLGKPGSSLGFMLVSRTCENRLTADELRSAVAVAPGLSRAIQSCQVLSPASDWKAHRGTPGENIK